MVTLTNHLVESESIFSVTGTDMIKRKSKFINHIGNYTPDGLFVSFSLILFGFGTYCVTLKNQIKVI